MHSFNADPIDERKHVADQLIPAVRAAPMGSRVTRVPALIRSHTAIAGSGEPWNHIAPGRGRLGKTMEQHDNRTIKRSLVRYIEDESVALESRQAFSGHREILRPLTIDMP
jgi:hypothetical protein